MDGGTHPGNTIRSHQPENIPLDPLVQFHGSLYLGSLERSLSIRSGVFRIFFIDGLHVRDELGSEIVVDVEFTWRCWGQVGCLVSADRSEGGIGWVRADRSGGFSGSD